MRYRIVWLEPNGIQQLAETAFHGELIGIVRLCKLAGVAYTVWEWRNDSLVQLLGY